MSKSIFITVLLWIIQALVVGTLISSDFIERAIREEREMMVTWLGASAADEMIAKADGRFIRWFKDSGAIDRSFHFFVPTEEERLNAKGMERLGEKIFPLAEQRLSVFWASVYQSVQRLSAFLMWMPYMLLIIVPAVVDGLLARKIKQVTFGYTSGTRYTAARHLLVFLAFAPMFYLATPISVHPVVVPLWAGLLAIALITLFSNVQKRI